MQYSVSVTLKACMAFVAVVEELLSGIKPLTLAATEQARYRRHWNWFVRKISQCII
jgi:hypothetical protein